MSLIGCCADDERVLNTSTQTYCATPVGDMVKAHEVSLLMNSAAAYLKLPPLPAPADATAGEEGLQGGAEDGPFQHPAKLALVAVDRALMLEPNSSKALLRRSVAHESLGEVRLALADASLALALEESRGHDASNGARLATCRRFLAKYQKMLRLEDKHSAAMYRRMLASPATTVSELAPDTNSSGDGAQAGRVVRAGYRQTKRMASTAVASRGQASGAQGGVGGEMGDGALAADFAAAAVAGIAGEDRHVGNMSRNGSEYQTPAYNSGLGLDLDLLVQGLRRVSAARPCTSAPAVEAGGGAVHAHAGRGVGRWNTAGGHSNTIDSLPQHVRVPTAAGAGSVELIREPFVEEIVEPPPKPRLVLPPSHVGAAAPSPLDSLSACSLPTLGSRLARPEGWPPVTDPGGKLAAQVHENDIQKASDTIRAGGWLYSGLCSEPLGGPGRVFTDPVRDPRGDRRPH